jgi:DNA-binding CsgD family transcriptional regulator
VSSGDARFVAGVPEIVGREEELRAIERWLEGPRPSALLIEGEAGIGKTTLVRAAVEAARERSLRVLVAKPTPAEASLSLTGIGDLLEGTLAEVLDELPTPQRRALAAALLLEEPQAEPDARALVVALLGSLRALARKRRLLVSIDDVQWLDNPSAVALGFAARRLAGDDVRLLLSRRTGHDDGVTPQLDDPERILLGGLSAGAIHRLLRERVDVVLGRPALHRLHELCGGNPFFALELARAYQRGEIGLGRGDRLPSSLDVLVAHRIAALPYETRVALAAASALSRPTASAVAPVEVLGTAVAAGVIALDGDEIRFTHPLLASAAYSALDHAQRRTLHARLATLTEDDEEEARHLALSSDGPDEAVAAALDRAAKLAAARGAPATAADLLEESRKLTPTSDREAVARRQRAEAGYASLAGDPERAVDLLEPLLASTPPGPARAEILAELGFVRLYGVDWRSSADFYRSALEEAKEDARLEARVEVGLAMILDLLQADLSEAIAHARRGAELADRVGNEALLAEALCLQAKDELLAGHGLPVALVERAVRLEPATAGLPTIQRPSDYAAVMRGLTDDFPGALAEFERIRLEALERGETAPFVWTVYRMALLECLTGDWRAANAHVEEGLEAALESREDANEAVLHAARSLIDAHVGSVDSARASAARALKLDARLAVTAARVTATWALGLLELSLNRPAEAHEQLDPLIRDRRSAGIAEPGAMRYVPDEIEALVELGRLDEAEELLAWFEERARTLDRASALAASARSRGLITAARGDTGAALAHLERAVAEHERVAMPFERARTLLVLGATQRRAKRRRTARETLGDALAFFERLGASHWADRARSELARVGGRAPSEGALTPAERRVAELVAEGRTNREVAAALYLSERTIEGHLSRVYGKLGVRSRAQLARQLSGGERPH